MLAALAIAAGVAAALQAAINAGLARSTGLGPALVLNTVVVLIGTIGLWAALGARASFFPAGTPWTLYLGGIGGFVIIATLAFVFPQIGGAYAVALMIGGQCVAALRDRPLRARRDAARSGDAPARRRRGARGRRGAADARLASDGMTTPHWRLPDPRAIQVLGHRIHYWDAGQGDPIVLIHGFSGSAVFEWGPVFEPLARRHRVVALQVIGFAPSEQPDIAYTTETLVNHLGEFMRALGLENVTLLGESFGGWHAAAYAAKAAAARQPPIAKLVLAGGAICVKGMPAPNARGFVSAELQAEADAFSAAFPSSNDSTKLLIARDSGLLRRDPSREELAAIAVPTLLLWGEQDELIPLACGEDAASLIPDAKLVVLPNVGHIPSIEAPGEFVRVVSEFASS